MKIKKLEKLSKNDQENLIYDLVFSLTQTKNISEAALFLQDLLTKSEIKILSKRLAIAKLLLKGMTYEEIEKVLHVSHSTVAKISFWLAERGEGFRNIVQKLHTEKKVDNGFKEFSDWDQIKRRYSMYFWPEILLEEIIKNANKRQKEKIKNVLSVLEEKSELHRKIDELLKV